MRVLNRFISYVIKVFSSLHQTIQFNHQYTRTAKRKKSTKTIIVNQCVCVRAEQLALWTLYSTTFTYEHPGCVFERMYTAYISNVFFFIHIEYLFTICPFSGIMTIIIIIICLWNYSEPYTKMNEGSRWQRGRKSGAELPSHIALFHSSMVISPAQQFWFMDNQLRRSDKLTMPRSCILIPKLFLTGKCIAYSRLTSADQNLFQLCTF